MPSLKQLRCLAALAETLHFHRAAERCHVSQPALSNQLVQLEERLGVMLVERTRRRVMLTPAGRDIAERAKTILRDVEDLRQAAQTARHPLAGTLRVGVLPTLGPYLLPHILPAMRRDYPELKLYLREEPAARMLQELRHGDLDLAIIGPPERGEDILTLPLLHEPLWAALPLRHPLAAKAALKPRDLAGERLLLLEAGHCLRDQSLEFCNAAGAAEHPDFRATSLDSLRQMVATGLGATLLPALYVAAEAIEDDQIAVRPFAAPGPERQISLAWRRSSTRVAEYRLFGALISENLPEVVRRSGTA